MVLVISLYLRNKYDLSFVTYVERNKLYFFFTTLNAEDVFVQPFNLRLIVRSQTAFISGASRPEQKGGLFSFSLTNKTHGN